ncbi:MAG: hypothetical protein EWM72_01457 [Nitrospira sp.]|nr:MAG: hypothetical protein EWM72_01457 [Nitrospira sp.]
MSSHMGFPPRYIVMSESHAAPYVSSGAFKTKSITEVVSCCLRYGFTHVECGSGMAWAPDLLAPIRQTASHQISYLVHNYFPPHENPFVLNLATNDELILTRSLQHCRVAIDLSAELGAPFFSVHAGFAFKANPEQLGGDLTGTTLFPLEKAHEIFVESLKTLCQYAMHKCVKLVVENNVIARFNLISGKNRLGLCATAEDILRTYADVGSSNLGFLVDVGHLKVTAEALGFDMHKFLDTVGPYIVAFHLSDNDGLSDQNLPFDERAWFIPRLAEFPHAVMVLEAYNLEPTQIHDNCRVIVQARTRVPSV